jgi:Holliday junction DNA helicase RuvA
MIAYLAGTVRRATEDQVVVDTGGVGYLVSIPANVREQVPPLGGEVQLHVHTHVREDQLALYGFATVEELELFKMLIEVDGVGPRVALAILGSAHIDVLKRAVVADDVAPIRRAPGVGAKTAAKVILELKPKLEAEAAVLTIPRVAANGHGSGEVPRQVEDALRGLGYTAQEARAALDAVDWGGSPGVQEALAAALKALARR